MHTDKTCDRPDWRRPATLTPSAVTDRTTGVIADQMIALDGHYTKQDYPAHLRRVRFRDPKTGKTVTAHPRIDAG